MARQDEEDRAALFRQQAIARCRNERARERQLSGNGAQRLTNYRNWEPLILARLESRQAGGRERDE